MDFVWRDQLKRKLKVETIQNHKGNINLVKVFYPVTLRILGCKNARHLGSENTSPPLRPLSLPQNHGGSFWFSSSTRCCVVEDVVFRCDGRVEVQKKTEGRECRMTENWNELCRGLSFIKLF